MPALRRFTRWARMRAQVRMTEPARGQVLVLYGFSMFVLIGMAALALDVSLALNAKREYQKVAAVCAVVGAQRLPAPVATLTPAPNPTAATGAARSCVTSNIPVTPTTNVPPQTGPHAGDSKFIEVIVSQPQTTVFGKVLGMTTLGAIGRAVAGGFLPADFAIMSLRGNIDSTISGGGNQGIVRGNACTRGQFKVNGNFYVEGQSVANQGFDGGSVPSSTAGNVTGGQNCVDPNYPLPAPLPTYTAPNTTGTTRLPDDLACPTSPAEVVSVTDSTATVQVNCSQGRVRIYNPRMLVTLNGANEATVELMGPSGSSGPGIFKRVEATASPGRTPLLILMPGYYDIVDVSALGSSSSSVANCGAYVATVCFKPGLYLMSTGFKGNNNVDIASQTTGPATPPAEGNGVSIVAGITFAPRSSGGGGGGLTLDCCASGMQNYVLLYHLGGCQLPYSDYASATTPRQPPDHTDPRLVFPAWPGSWSCPTPDNTYPNLLSLQGNNRVQKYNGTIYSPYQCSNSPNPDTTFPAKCASGSAAPPVGATRLPQFECGTPSSPSYCIAVGGGTTEFNGQMIAPSISISGSGVTIAPPNGLPSLGTQPYLAE